MVRAEQRVCYVSSDIGANADAERCSICATNDHSQHHTDGGALGEAVGDTFSGADCFIDSDAVCEPDCGPDECALVEAIVGPNVDGHSSG